MDGESLDGEIPMKALLEWGLKKEAKSGKFSKGNWKMAKEVGLTAYKKIIDLMAYLDEAFPAYPPLKHFVNEEGAP